MYAGPRAIQEDRELDEPFVTNAYGDLKRVIMHRPGRELTMVNDETLAEFHFDRPVDRGAFVSEYDTMLGLFQAHGVETLLLTDILKEDRDSMVYMARRPNMTYTRDLASVFSRGAVLMAPHLKGRWGDQVMLARAFRRLGVPILGAIDPPGTILDGWTLVGINGADREIYRRIDLTGAVVPDDGLLVIATGRATLELVLELDFIANVDWQNGPDAVQLWSATNTLVDALQYGDAGPGNAGEGAPVLDAPPGLGLSRRNGSDSDDNATDFVVTAPTPGRRARPLAEPRSLWLLSLGGVLSLIGGRVGRGRKRWPSSPG